MSITSGPINEAEQAAEKAADHIGQQTAPLLIQLMDAFFERLSKLRITIDISSK